MADLKWPENVPDSLSRICLEYIAQNLESTICDFDSTDDSYRLKPTASLPHPLGDSLLRTCSDIRKPLTQKKLHIFEDLERTTLKRLNVDYEKNLTDDDLERLIVHQPIEISISSENLTRHSLELINKHGRCLTSLTFGPEAVNIFQDDNDLHWDKKDNMCCDKNDDFCGLNCLNLRFLSINCIVDSVRFDLVSFIPCMTKLTVLDLSDSDIDPLHLKSLSYLSELQIVNLHNVVISDISTALDALSELKTLRVLDLGQSIDDEPVCYDGDITGMMKNLITNLPKLTRLEISGTNLAGELKEDDPISHRPENCKKSKLPLEQIKPPIAISWMDDSRRMEYLGLLNCAHKACERENIPANQITGDASEEQILLSLQAYTNRKEFLLLSLNNLFQLFRFSDCVNQRRALEGILTSMKLYQSVREIQISGSASLFYIVKGEAKHYFNTKIRRDMIKLLLDAMEIHLDESTMLRNGCLTLCHFKLPQDVMHSYERLVSLLLKIVMVGPPHYDNFVQRIGIYLLNSLACQVDNAEKELIGRLGAFTTMLQIIQEKLNAGICDEVMEVAWSMMWNVTDETALNCQRFIDEKGMDIFIECLRKFSSHEDLLRNMMGLLGNVAEVHYLRPRLMSSEYVWIFSNLLDSTSDGIEVSYNACGVLAHMMSDGPSAWSVSEPTRSSVLTKMSSAMNRWKLNTKRNINYRSFIPILKLLHKYDTPQVQHWAVWALCNLTKMYKSKYCPLLERENGLPLLRSLIADPRPYAEIKSLAHQVIARCANYETSPEYASDDEPADPDVPENMNAE